MINNDELNKKIESQTTLAADEVTNKLDDLSEDELEAVKKRLTEIKAKRAKEAEEKKVFTREELEWRFEYYIMQKSNEFKATIAAYVLSLMVLVAFILVMIINQDQTMLYGAGFAGLFVAAITFYLISTKKDIKALKEGIKEPFLNQKLVVHEKTWYEMEFDKLSEEEKEARRKKFKNYNKIFGRFSKK